MNLEARPDFIIIGAMKCGTSTLHAQLGFQPGMHMSEPKEPNFFSDDDVFQRGLDWYRSLFADAAPGDLRGESSTHYTKLPTHPQTLERLQSAFGDTPLKLIYLMRHPVDRLISHFIHEWSEGRYPESISQAIEEYEELIEYGCYAKQLKPWLDAFGKESVLPLFADGLRKHPQRTLQKVCDFIGYQGEVNWRMDEVDHNVGRLRVRKSPLLDFASKPPVRWLRRTFIPLTWRDRFKRRWMMTEKPTLSSSARLEVEQIFDRDLKTLGDWLDLELNCSIWKSIAAEANLEWAKE